MELVGGEAEPGAPSFLPTCCCLTLSAIIIVFNLNDVASLEHTKCVRMAKSREGSEEGGAKGCLGLSGGLCRRNQDQSSAVMERGARGAGGGSGELLAGRGKAGGQGLSAHSVLTAVQYLWQAVAR